VGRRRRFSISVFAQGETGPVASAEFGPYGARDEFKCREVFVDPAHRRRGLANAMYVEAERIGGGPLTPFADQKPEGVAFWAQPGRPFGIRRR
jgi:GNAT superfamily N-acetyltransferase